MTRIDENNHHRQKMRKIEDLGLLGLKQMTHGFKGWHGVKMQAVKLFTHSEHLYHCMSEEDMQHLIFVLIENSERLRNAMLKDYDHFKEEHGNKYLIKNAIESDNYLNYKYEVIKVKRGQKGSGYELITRPRQR